MDYREKFLRIYVNLPLGVRNTEIIVVIDDEPLTWSAARIEVENKTLKGDKILEELVKMEIIE